MRAPDCIHYDRRKCTVPDAATARCVLTGDPRVSACNWFIMKLERTPEAIAQKQVDQKAARRVPAREFGAPPRTGGMGPVTTLVSVPAKQTAAPAANPFDTLLKGLK